MSNVHLFYYILGCNAVLSTACILLVFFLAYSVTLKMEAVWSCKMSEGMYQSSWLYIPEDSILQSLL